MRNVSRLVRYGRRFIIDRKYRNRILELIQRQAQGASHSDVVGNVDSALDVKFLQNKRLFLAAGCELTSVTEYLQTLGMTTCHSRAIGRPSDPMTEFLTPGSRGIAESWDYYILSVAQIFRRLIRHIQLEGIHYRKEQQEKDLGDVLDNFRQAILAIREKTGAPIFLFSYVLTYLPAYGLHEYRSMQNGWSLIEFWHVFHLRLYELAREFPSVYTLDADLALQATGKSSAINPQESNGMFDHLSWEGVKLLGDHFVQHVAILEANRRRIKCAVFDLDGTLWAGILREDGPRGVAVREYYLNTMEILSSRGILLAICSKNDPAEVSCLADLIGKDLYAKIVSCHLSWKPKSQVLRDIADELNIGMDSLALFDDSPFERAEVAANAPEVELLSLDQIFRCPSFPEFQQPGEITAESLSRTTEYQRATVRKEAELVSGKLDDFLFSCELKLDVKRALPADLPRIYELLERTNQLNATLARTSSEALKELFDKPGSYDLLTARLSDRFGDYGLVGCAVVTKTAGQWQVPELAISCRAAGRGIEQAMLSHIAADAHAAGAGSLAIHFHCGKRNQQIYRILRDCGFSSENGAAPVDGSSIRLVWKFEGSATIKAPEWLTMSSGSEDVPLSVPQ